MGPLAWLRRTFAPHDSGGFDRQGNGWVPVNGRGEQVNQMSRDIVRSRARDLERNSDNVAAVVDAYERNVVGTGIRLQAKIKGRDGLDDEVLNDIIEELWEQWSKAQNCDVTGQWAFSEMQSMGVRRRLVDGGLLYVFCDAPHKRIPFQLQIKEVDELDTSVTSFKAGSEDHKVVGGIELTDWGQPVAYHFKEYDVHGWSGRSIRVPADKVVYLTHRTRPTEVREFSPLGKIIVRMRDLTEYMEAVSVKERVLACLSVFIKRKGGGTTGIGNPNRREKVDGETGYKQKKLAPGTIEYLEPGDDVDVVNPSGQSSNAREFITIMLRGIGSALGLSYEAASRDMSQVNYSSARQGMIDDQKTYKRWQRYLIDHLCEPVYVRFLEVCVLHGLVDIPDFYQRKEHYTKCMFIPNGVPWIDPLKEVRANMYALESNQTTLEEICAATGKDYREVLKQRANELALIRELGLDTKGVIDVAPHPTDQ